MGPSTLIGNGWMTVDRVESRERSTKPEKAGDLESGARPDPTRFVVAGSQGLLRAGRSLEVYATGVARSRAVIPSADYPLAALS